MRNGVVKEWAGASCLFLAFFFWQKARDRGPLSLCGLGGLEVCRERCMQRRGLVGVAISRRPTDRPRPWGGGGSNEPLDSLPSVCEAMQTSLCHVLHVDRGPCGAMGPSWHGTAPARSPVPLPPSPPLGTHLPRRLGQIFFRAFGQSEIFFGASKTSTTGGQPPPPPHPQENDPADAHPRALKSVLESANPRMDSEGASG